MIKVQNKSPQVLPLHFGSDQTVMLYSRQSVILDDSKFTPQIKNLEEQKVVKVTRI